MKKLLKLCFLILIFPLLAYASVHKYYVSVMQIDYVPKQQSVQITSRIFIDDLENALKDAYGEHIILADKDEPKTVNLYIARYLKENIEIKINTKIADLVFIGKKYDSDILICYLEIENVGSIQSLEITNRILFDAYKEQQNMIKTNINAKKKSYLLIPENDNALLNFN